MSLDHLLSECAVGIVLIVGLVAVWYLASTGQEKGVNDD